MVNWMPIWKYVECCTFYICVHETGLAFWASDCFGVLWMQFAFGTQKFVSLRKP